MENLGVYVSIAVFVAAWVGWIVVGWIVAGGRHGWSWTIRIGGGFIIGALAFGGVGALVLPKYDRHESASAVPIVSSRADDAAQTDPLDALRNDAMAGDYQSQRNLAFALATGSGAQGRQNPMLGCAWYKVILLSGSEKIHDGDIGNVQVYCGMLTQEQQAVADAQAQSLVAKIYSR